MPTQRAAKADPYQRTARHQLGAVTLQISEAFIDARIPNAKSEQLRIEAKAFREIRTDKFGDQSGARDEPFGHAGLPRGGFSGEWRKRGTRHDLLIFLS